MLRSWKLAIALLALTLSLAHAGKVGAQAPAADDAPKKGRFTIELGITTQGLKLNFNVQNGAPEGTPAIDAMCPNIMPAYVQAMVNRLKAAFTGVPGAQGANMELDRDRQVAQLFEVAEIYRRTGQFASARTCYQRAHQAAPTTKLGQLAIERIGEMEDRLRDAEESSATDPESSFYNMRERTIPLGLAEPQIY